MCVCVCVRVHSVVYSTHYVLEIENSMALDNVKVNIQRLFLGLLEFNPDVQPE